MLRVIVAALAVVTVAAFAAPVAFAANGYHEQSRTCVGNNIVQHCGTTDGGDYKCWDEYVSQCR